MKGAPRQRFIPPQLATLVDTVPTGAGWTFEVKYDGYRLEAIIDDGKARLLTRRGNDWTPKFDAIAGRLEKLPVASAILDGEVVVLDDAGRSMFYLLRDGLDGSGAQDLVYFAFDLLALNGEDVRTFPLSARRELLERILRKGRATTRGAVRLGQKLDGSGSALIKAACRIGLEGVIGKQVDAPYRSGRGRSWIKVKCGKRQEFVIVGFTPPQGSRAGLGSLLLAVYERGKLRYAGRVGSGFDDALLRALLKQLSAIERDAPPLPARPLGIPVQTRWVAPSLVAEVSFTEWTPDGLLRHPVFQGLRTDKPAREIRRERAR